MLQTGNIPKNTVHGNRKDAGAWAYDHRVGLCLVVIVYLLGAIVFMSVKIAIGKQHTTQGYFVNIQAERPEIEKQQPVPEKQLRGSDDFSKVHNQVSNEGSSQTSQAGSRGLNSHLRDDRGTDASKIYDEAAAAMAGSAANAAAYQEGLRQAQAAGQRGAQTGSGGNSGQGGSDVRVKGNVTVSFTLINPLRQSVKLIIPAYLCRGGGEVIVDITVNRNGTVTAASVAKASSNDDCMTSTALNAALSSKFNVDASAPERQRGTIDYIFIPQ